MADTYVAAVRQYRVRLDVSSHYCEPQGVVAEPRETAEFPAVRNQFPLGRDLEDFGLIFEHENLRLLLIKQISICFKNYFILPCLVHRPNYLN